MKRLLPLLLLEVLLLALPGGTALADNKFHFDSSVNVVMEGGTLQLVLVREGDCEEGELTFSSANTSNATVDENGVVTGLKKGAATITAKLKGKNRTWTAQIRVTVARAVTSVEVTGSNLKTYNPWDETVANILDPNSSYADLPVMVLRVGQSQTITAVCKPSDATNRKWALSSSDAAIVRASGTTFTGKKAGECMVRVYSQQNPDVYQAFRALVVQPVTRVRVTSDITNIYVGDVIILDPQITPDNATIQDVTWSSSRADNASVDEYGVVTGVSKGSAVITAKAADGSGKYGTITINVKQQAEEVQLNRDEFILKVGNYLTLRATVLPDITNDKTVTWSSSDLDVARVNSSGRVTGVGPGSAVITCASKTHPDVYAQSVVTIYQAVEKISFTESTVYVGVGQQIRVNWSVSPANATDPTVTLSTNKENVLRVEQDGTITGLKRGEAYVYATANDGFGKKGTIKVIVTQPVEGVGIATEHITVGVGESTTNSAVFMPEDASITKMKWTVQDATIASVSGTDRRVTVKGLGWGETTVIGVSEDGSYVTTFTVSVGDENKPLAITNLYVEDGSTIRIQVYNQSNLNITRFYYVIETYDAWGYPVVCNRNGRSNSFEGYYGYTLTPGSATRHGRFTFGSEFSRPNSIGHVVMRITGYETDAGSHYIPRSEQVRREWKVTVWEE